MLESNFTRLTKISTKIPNKNKNKNIIFVEIFVGLRPVLFQVFVSFLVFSKSKLCKNNKKIKKFLKIFYENTRISKKNM